MSSEQIALGLSIALPGLAFVVWLVRLEGRVNSGDKADMAMIERIIRAETAAAMRDEKHDRLNDGLIRMQEQLKYLTSLFERHFVEGPTKPTRRGPST